jgi:predicted nucleic acid-binding protein
VVCLPGLVDLGDQPGIGADGGQTVEPVRVADPAGDHSAGDRPDAGCRGDDPGGVGLGVEVRAALVEVFDLFGEHLGLLGLLGLHADPDVDEWNNRIERGLVHITNLTRLEIGCSARTGAAARRDLREPPLAAMPVEYLTPAIEGRALELQLLLADAGKHRGPSIPDLLIAATAELVGLTVLHVDKDFEVISELTGQPTQRLELSGSESAP